MQDRDHDEAMSDVFIKDPEYAAQLYEALLLDGSPEEITTIQRQLEAAFGKELGKASNIIGAIRGHSKPV